MKNAKEELIQVLTAGEIVCAEIYFSPNYGEDSYEYKLKIDYTNNELIDFINSFYINHNIPLDLIYTSKMIFGLHDLINLRKIPKGSNILLIHTGGLQGNIGMNSIHNLNLHVK